MSLSRFGDGELNILMGGDIHFQKYDERLKTRLLEILKLRNIKGFCVGIPYEINSYSNLKRDNYDFWRMNMKTGRMHWHRFCRGGIFLDSQFTWRYSLAKDKKMGIKVLKQIKDVWNEKDILIVEGKESPLGLYDSFLDGAKTIKRVVCPSKNAFDKYDEILEMIKSTRKNELVLLSLGPTASVLAYDLYLCGIRAIDIGHINIPFRECRKDMNVKLDNSLSEKEYKSQIVQVIE